METATAISGLNFFGLARASVLQGQQFIDFFFSFPPLVWKLCCLFKSESRIIGPERDKLEETHFRIFFGYYVLTVKDSGETWGEFLIFSQTFCSLIY